MVKKSLLVFSILFMIMTAFVWFTPDNTYSDSERRLLAKRPALDSKITEKFENYVADQFPFRDGFRALKNNVLRSVFLRADSNGLYKYDGHLSKLDYPLNPVSVEHFNDLFMGLFRAFDIDDARIVIVPDKNSFTDRPSVLVEELAEKIEIEQIRIDDLLTLDDYYRSDSHWKNERLQPIADKILVSFGKNSNTTYELRTLDLEFKGVYAGQSMLACEADTIAYLYSDIYDQVSLKDYKGRKIELFDMAKAEGKDPYEFFMAGTQPYILLENDACESGDELVVFRDSYGSSLIPLLISSYSKIHVFDVRYMSLESVGGFVDLETDKDVLLLYSTTIINSSFSLK